MKKPSPVLLLLGKGFDLRGYYMRYFIDEKQRRESHSTCYFEFQRGRYNEKCWKDDSLNISDEDFQELNLPDIFLNVIPDFDFFEITEVDSEQWEGIKRILSEKGGGYEKILIELEPWVSENFKDFNVFTILGM